MREVLGDFLEQWRFLSAGHGDLFAFGERGLELPEVQTAKLVRLRQVGRTAAPDRLRVERHGLLATANQKAGLCADHALRP